MTTPRLHYDDPLRLEADAKVVAHGERDGRATLVLDETIFYPESGGQLGDRGTVAEAVVVDVQLDEAGVVHHILHVLEEGVRPAVGAIVTCAVDGPRRRQHMALHTGQHCLSRALLDLYEAVTISSRLGASGCTIDVDRSGLDLACAQNAQDLVNAIIDEDRPVRQYFPAPSELKALPLRKAPVAKGRIRIVDVGGFDITPCGGTHVKHTAQIELIYVRSVERYKGGTRFTFDAGPRARAQLLAHRSAILDAAAALRCAPHELLEATAKHKARLDESRHAEKNLRESLADLWAERLDGEDPVIATLLGASAELLGAVAARLATGARLVALAAPSSEGVAVLIARGPDGHAHAGDLLRDVAARTGGRGGGRPERAQGRLPVDADFESALRAALGASA